MIYHLCQSVFTHTQTKHWTQKKIKKSTHILNTTKKNKKKNTHAHTQKQNTEHNEKQENTNTHTITHKQSVTQKEKREENATFSSMAQMKEAMQCQLTKPFPKNH